MGKPTQSGRDLKQSTFKSPVRDSNRGPQRWKAWSPLIYIGKLYCCFPKTWPNFIELLSTKICSALNFFLDKNRITNQIPICCILLVTGTQLLFTYPENHVEIWSVILFLSREKFHAKQIVMLSSSMKLGSGADYFHSEDHECFTIILLSRKNK